jgi:hypothetical protein
LPRNRIAENVRLRVGPYPRTTLITSNPTEVSGRFSCNTRTLEAYVVTTTTRIGIKRDASKRSSSQVNQGTLYLTGRQIMFSFFDQLFHSFECSNPKCRHKFHGLSRWLVHANEVVCPKCGTRQNIELDQTAGKLGEDFDSANELNMKAREKKKLGT